MRCVRSPGGRTQLAAGNSSRLLELRYLSENGAEIQRVGEKGLPVTEVSGVVRRRQYCGLCGQLMFEFYRSPDGHFGIVDDVAEFRDPARGEIRCPTCNARYKLLERIDPTGAPVRKV